MAIDKKTLKMFLDNPAMYSADELEDEQPEVEAMPEVEPEEPMDESEEPELVASDDDMEMDDEPTAMEEGVDQQVVSDTRASPEMRKKALQRIKQKYLGQ